MADRTHKPRDGKIFQEYLRSRSESPQTAKAILLPLTKNKRNNVLRMERSHGTLMDAFAALQEFDGLFIDLELGALNRILPMHCTEELVHYLDKVGSIWRGMCDHGARSQDIDMQTVRGIELLCPLHSIEDQQRLSTLFESRKVFCSVQEHNRGQLLSHVLSRSRLITIRSFLQDTLYLEACHHALRTILPWQHRSDSDTYRKHVRSCYKGRNDHFLVNYVELWLFAMRHFEQLGDGPCNTPRKDAGRSKRYRAAIDPHHIQRLAYLASGLRFDTQDIQNHLRGCPARPQQPKSVEALLTSDLPIAQKLRCGRPTGSSQRRLQGLITWENISRPLSSPIHDYPTTFAIIQDIVNCFFGVGSLDHGDKLRYDYTIAEQLVPDTGHVHQESSPREHDTLVARDQSEQAEHPAAERLFQAEPQASPPGEAPIGVVGHTSTGGMTQLDVMELDTPERQSEITSDASTMEPTRKRALEHAGNAPTGNMHHGFRFHDVLWDTDNYLYVISSGHEQIQLQTRYWKAYEEYQTTYYIYHWLRVEIDAFEEELRPVFADRSQAVLLEKGRNDDISTNEGGRKAVPNVETMRQGLEHGDFKFVYIQRKSSAEEQLDEIS